MEVKLPFRVMEELEPSLPRQQLFQQMVRREGGILAEPAARKKDLRAIMDLLLLAPHQAPGFLRRLCFPGIAWLTIFPEQTSKGGLLPALLVLLRGLRLLFYICWYLLRV